jgi:hypothetical protein
MGKWKFYSINFAVEWIWWHFWYLYWSPETNKWTQNFKIWRIKGNPSYKFRLRRIRTCVLLRKFHHRTNLTELYLGPETKKKSQKKTKRICLVVNTGEESLKSNFRKIWIMLRSFPYHWTKVSSNLFYDEISYTRYLDFRFQLICMEGGLKFKFSKILR